jgi:hypothetical protein
LANVYNFEAKGVENNDQRRYSGYAYSEENYPSHSLAEITRKNTLKRMRRESQASNSDDK